MTQFLPPSLLALFAPRPPIAFLPPEDLTKKLPPYTGVGQFVHLFEDQTKNPPTEEGHLILRRKELNRYNSRKRVREHQSKNDELVKAWDPHKDPKTTGDPYKTLFICRLSYNTSDHKLKREFEMYGPVKKVRIIADQEGKPRGYGFIEFEKERDMRAAYKQADGKKIDGKRILVDLERGRTARGWKPRRYGGGLGYTRASDEDRRIIREREAAMRGSDDKDRDRDKEKDKDREKDKDKERDHKDRDKKDRDSHRDKERDRERDRERDKDRSKDKDKDKSRDRERRH